VLASDGIIEVVAEGEEADLHRGDRSCPQVKPATRKVLRSGTAIVFELSNLGRHDHSQLRPNA
jgi:hypothetical protein